MVRRSMAAAFAATVMACSGGSGGSSAGGGAPVTGTVASRNAAGIAALQSSLGSGSTASYVAATDEFAAAVSLIPTDGTATANDKDKARFFHALGRVAALANPLGDGAVDGLNDLGDILDAFGVRTGAGDRDTFDPSLVQSCTEEWVPTWGGYGYTRTTCAFLPISAASPTAGALQTFLVDKLAARLREAIALLDAVSPSFQAQVQESGRDVQFDYTDALFAKALAQGVLAVLEAQGAYDVDVDLYQLRAKLEAAAPYGIGDFLADHPSFLRLVNAAVLPQSRTDALAAVRTARAAILQLRAETDPQADDFVQIADRQCWYDYVHYVYTCSTTYNASATLDEYASYLATVDAVLSAAGPYTLTMGTTDPADDLGLDASRFFAGLDLRALLPATYTAGLQGDRPGLFPDPTFGGLLVSGPWNVNQDVDQDGSPDFLDGYTYFGAWLRGHSMGTWGWSPGSLSGTFQFAPSGSGFTFTDSSYATASGTWSVLKNVLTLTFPVALSNGVKTVVITADDLSDPGAFYATVTYRDSVDSVLTVASQSFWFW